MRFSWFCVAIIAALFSRTALVGAVGTRMFDLDTLEKLSGGDLKGVAISSDGTLRAGWTLSNVPLNEASASWAVLSSDGGAVLVGTSPGGKVFRVVGGEATLFADTGSLAVTSLVQGASGSIFAATLPDGRIFKLSPGKAELFTTLADVSDVWALAFDKAHSALYAATGPEGKVFRISNDGKATIYLRTDEPHIVCLSLMDNGDLLAGSSGKGLLYRITGPGQASVLFDFPGEEVKAVATSKAGTIFAISNEYGEPPEPPKRAGAGRAAAGPATGTRPKPGKGSLYRFDAKGRPEKMMHHDEFQYMSLALDDSAQPYIGTGAEGRVYTVDDAHTVTLVADTDERQIGALALAGGTGVTRTTEGSAGAKAFPTGVIVSSDPVVVHRIVAQGGADTVWTSKALDAGLRAKFGQLSWRATGALELSTRTGNAATPDATWTPWSQPITASAQVRSAPGRFVQVRARWSRDPRAQLSQVLLPFVTENVRPVVLEIGAQPKNAPAHDTKEGLPPSGGEPPKHDSVLRVTWKVDNPDNDALRYRVTFRREGQNLWRDVTASDEVLTKSEMEWDTLALPEGKYRVRVDASDEIANPPDTAQHHALESSPLLVDNTPPIFRGLALNGRRLRGQVVDGVGPIVRVEVAVDGKLQWRPIGAADGVFDSSDEGIDTDITTFVPPGAHIVAVRAFDAAGNPVIQELESM